MDSLVRALGASSDQLKVCICVYEYVRLCVSSL